MAKKLKSQRKIWRRLCSSGAHLVRLGPKRTASGQWDRSGKLPLDHGWQKPENALTSIAAGKHHDPERGRRIGIKPSSLGCFVVDIDGNARETAPKIAEMIGQNPIMVTRSSEKGHGHLWFRSSAKVVPNAEWRIPGLSKGEIRGSSGYVVIWFPESMEYLLDNLPDAKLVSARKFLRACESMSDEGRWSSLSIIEKLETLPINPSGTRNSRLFHTACLVVEAGWMNGEVRQKLIDGALESGLDMHEIETTLKSAERTTAPEIDVEIDFEDVAEDEPEPEKPAKRPKKKKKAKGRVFTKHRLAAERFRRKAKGRWKFNVQTGKWLKWAEHSWQIDERNEVGGMCTGIAERMATLAEKPSDQAEYGRLAFIKGTLGMLEVLPGMTTSIEDWDADPMVVGLPNRRCMDLSGSAGPKPQGMDDMLTMRLACEPASRPSDLWIRFMHELTAGCERRERGSQRAVVRWLQAFCYTCLHGDTSIEKFLFVQGKPGTGKSTFVDTVRHVVGDYAATVAGENIAGVSNQHRQWLARLQGKRMCLINELPTKHAAWNSPILNALVSGDVPIVANYMRQDDIEFVSTASVVIAGNTRPYAPSNSGIFRRMVLLECNEKPEKVNTHLKSQLRDEAPGVLTWMLGARNHWRETLHQVPEVMQSVVEEYCMAIDPFAEWLRACCETGIGYEAPVKRLYQSYINHCQEHGIDKPMTSGQVGRKLHEIGHELKEKGRMYSTGNGTRDRFRVGIRLTQNLESDDDLLASIL